MDIYILNSSLQRTRLVRKYESLTWITRYNDLGEFTLVCDVSLFSYFSGNHIFIENTADDRYFGRVDSIEKQTDADGKTSLTVKGRMAESILYKRVARTSVNFKTQNAWYVSKKLIDANFRTPTDPNRTISMVGHCPLITMPQVAFEGLRGAYIYDLMQQLAVQIGWGFSLELGGTTARINWYCGVDRTIDQTINEAFIAEQKRGTVTSMSYFKEMTGRKTVAVADCFENMQYTFPEVSADGGVGLDRDEAYFDLTSLDKTVYNENEEEETLTDAEYEILVQNELTGRLMQCINSEYLDTKISLTATDGFRTKFYLGDIITTKDSESGFMQDMRITEATEVYSVSGYDLSIQVGEVSQAYAAKIYGETKQGSTGLPYLKVTAQYLNAAYAKIDLANIAEATIKNAMIESLSANKITAGTINASLIDVTNIDADNIVAGTLDASKVLVTNLDASNIKSGSIDATLIDVLNLNASNIATGQLDASLVDVINLNASNIVSGQIDASLIDVINLSANSIVSGQIDAALIDVLHLDAANITAGSLTSDRMKANIVAAINASIETAKISSAKIDTAEIVNLVAGQVDADFITAKIATVDNGFLNAVIANSGQITSALIEDAAIVDAKIADLSANKITAGTLSVERLLIGGATGGLLFALNNYGELTSTEVDSLDADLLTPRTITADKIVAESITAAEIATGAISAIKLAAESVTAAAIKAGEIDASKLNVAFVQSGIFHANSGVIGGFDIDSSHIAKGTSLLGSVDDENVGGVYIGADGISCGSKFQVDSLGNIVASGLSLSMLDEEAYDLITGMDEALALLQSTVTSQGDSLADDIANAIAETKAYADSQLTSYINTQNQYLRFTTEDGLILGQTTSLFNTQITNSQMNFRYGSSILAYMSGSNFCIQKGAVTGTLKIGNFSLRSEEGALNIVLDA